MSKNNTWKTEHSIYSFIKSELNEEGIFKLGNLEKFHNHEEEKPILFAPGLIDAFSPEDDTEATKDFIALLIKHLNNVNLENSEEDKEYFFNLITQDVQVIGYIDDFLSQFAEQADKITTHLLDFGKELAFQTNKENAVKMGIAILGSAGDEAIIPELKTLGTYDEFSVFSMIAIMNILDNPVVELWDLAKKVQGWGRIHLITKMVEFDLSDEIKEWILLEGYQNSILDEYLAYTCAVKGELHEFIKRQDLTEEEFQSIEELLDALIAEISPAETIYDYEHSAEVIKDFIHHAPNFITDSYDYYLLNKIKQFLIDLVEDEDEHNRNGWELDDISNCIIEVIALLKDRDWKAIVMNDIADEDKSVYGYAVEVASLLELDIWDELYKNLKNDPEDPAHWWNITHYSKDEHYEEILTFASDYLMNKAPKTEKEEFSQFMRFDMIISYLEKFPGKGEDFILAYLSKRPLININTVLRTLEQWGVNTVSEEIKNELLLVQKEMQDERITTNIERFLNGEALDWTIYLEDSSEEVESNFDYDDDEDFEDFEDEDFDDF